VAGAVLGAIGTIPINLDQPAGALPLSARQLVVLARALVRLPSVLLLDEASAALDFADRDLLFQAIEDYARAGNIVIFISHRLDEVQRLSDRVTVLRNGRIVETLGRDQTTTERLLKLMIPQAEFA
jgi:ribose transport system ATP-binding protein